MLLYSEHKYSLEGAHDGSTKQTRIITYNKTALSQSQINLLNLQNKFAKPSKFLSPQQADGVLRNIAPPGQVLLTLGTHVASHGVFCVNKIEHHLEHRITYLETRFLLHYTALKQALDKKTTDVLVGDDLGDFERVTTGNNELEPQSVKPY